MSDKTPFEVIAERRLQLTGPDQRDVQVRIGRPEQDEKDFRCPYQVVGLSDDEVKYSHGVDSMQALHLAFAGARRDIKTTVDALAGFHDDLKLESEAGPWDIVFPLTVPVFNREQLRRLEEFLQELWQDQGAT